MNSAGINEVTGSTQRKLRRTLEIEFGNSLILFTENRHVYFMPDSLKKEILGAECIRLKSKLEAFQKGNKDKSIVKTALSLREQIKSIPTKDNWPPNPTELASDYITVPPALEVKMVLPA